MREEDDWKGSSFHQASAACTVMSEDISFSLAAESKAAVNQVKHTSVEWSCCQPSEAHECGVKLLY